MNENQKSELYVSAAKEVAAVIEGEPNLIARMASVSNILHHSFDHYYWTGFYIVDPERSGELVVGPYQGSLGCLRIPFGRGVCGTAASQKKTQIVDDVHSFPGHITCDVRSQSEIVVPVLNELGELIAVFDVDSDQTAQFDTVDRVGLEAIIEASFA